MKSKIVWLVASYLILTALILVACGPATTTTPPTTPPATTPPTTTPPTTTAKPAGEPQYGGTIVARWTTSPVHFDPYWFADSNSERIQTFWLEQLGMGDWAVDRQKWDFTIPYVPLQYAKGCLAESWEQPDPSTIVFHIRKGVRWQDKPPVNGRELTADDITYSYHRQLGLGSGFTKRSPFISPGRFELIESVVATDKYTVVFKAKTPSLALLHSLVTEGMSDLIVAREAVEKYGDLEDWRHAVGTGPFVLKDYVPASSITFERNPTYWGWDERYPKNSIPYVDNVKMLIIPDQATALGALRSDKLDMIDGLSWELAEHLRKTNPEILQFSGWGASGAAVALRNDKEPFRNIKVRKALQMSLDLDTIAKTYYGGVVEGTPYGLIGPALKGFYTPFDEWPREVREGYIYNPEKAKQLLAEAGYPNGFKTNLLFGSTTPGEVQLAEIVKGYLAKIGVDVEIKALEWGAFGATVYGKKHEAMCWVGGTAFNTDPFVALFWRHSTATWNFAINNDPVFDELYSRAQASLDPAEQQRLIKQADDYAIAQQWVLPLPPKRSYSAYQAWLKGYSGEFELGLHQIGPLWARRWVVTR